MTKLIRETLRKDALKGLSDSIRELNDGERRYLLRKLSNELENNTDLVEDGELNNAGLVLGGLMEVLLLHEICS